MEQDYISFLYGWNALSKKPERTALSVDDPAVFQNVDLANTFFRCIELELRLMACAHTCHGNLTLLRYYQIHEQYNCHLHKCFYLCMSISTLNTLKCSSSFVLHVVQEY